MNYDVRIEQFPGRPLAVVRLQASLQQLGPVIQQACGTVWNVVRTKGMKRWPARHDLPGQCLPP